MKTYTHLMSLLVRSMTHSNKKILFFIATLFFSGLTSFAQVNIVFNPPSTSVEVGQPFTVNVRAQFIAGEMDVVAIHFNFDNTRLAITSATNAPSASILPNVLIPLQPVGTMNTNGRVNYVAGTSSNFPTTDFTVISVTFTTLQVGSTPLTFRRPPTPNPVTNAIRAAVSVLGSVTNTTIIINGVGCTPPSATISAPGGATTCNSQAFNLVLPASPAPAGTAPFDLTIAGPAGTATFNNIPVGGIITNFVPPIERIWPTAPATIPPTSEDATVTLGVKFRSSVSGFVKGVRFFSPDEVSLVPGTYTGQLWTAGGILLATETFTGVTTSSWQEILFSTPVLITAGTVYTASYHTNDIKYVGTAGGLTTAVTNGSLTALDNVSSGGNGVYAYGGTATFPTIAVNTNYWVDVLFSPNVYTFNLTGVKDAQECNNTGALQTLTVTSVDCSTLPVSFLNLSATSKDETITLRWATASEINNLGFEVQRSSNGAGWSAIGFVNGAGNSTSTQKYVYIDEKLVSSRRYYYRLKQIDIDQRFAYSPVVSAALDTKENFVLEQNYPNPFRNETIIKFTLPQKAKVNLSLFDMNGRLVKILVNESKESGTHAVTLNSGIFTSGLYYYKLQADDFSAVKKMIIQ